MASDAKSAPADGPVVLNLPLQRTWAVVQPRVYRFMKKEFIDAFFADGSLMLSSFDRFATHGDEQRNDPTEGTGVRVLTGNDFTTVMATGRGFDCYVLCGSTLNTRALQECFPDTGACLAIDDPLSFANAVSSSVPGFRGGFSGHCIYQDDTVIRRHSDTLSLEDTMPKSLEDIPKLAAQAGGVEEFFVKHSRYAAQAEYRMLWQSGLPIEPFLIVKAPDACRFCRRA